MKVAHNADQLVSSGTALQNIDKDIHIIKIPIQLYCPKLGKAIERFYIVRALQFYLEGVGLSGIDRIIGINYVTGMNWIKKYGKELEGLRSEILIDTIVEIDELLIQ